MTTCSECRPSKLNLPSGATYGPVILCPKHAAVDDLVRAASNYRCMVRSEGPADITFRAGEELDAALARVRPESLGTNPPAGVVE